MNEDSNVERKSLYSRNFHDTKYKFLLQTVGRYLFKRYFLFCHTNILALEAGFEKHQVKVQITNPPKQISFIKSTTSTETNKLHQDLGLLCLRQVRDGWAVFVVVFVCVFFFSHLSYLPFLMPPLFGDGWIY